MVRTEFILYFGIVILNSCNPRNEKKISQIDSLSKDDSVGKRANDSRISSNRPRRHDIRYTDTVNFSREKLSIDTSLTLIKCLDTIVSYRINLVTNEVARLCANRSRPYKITNVILNKRKISWDTLNGFPNEFIGDYLFSDIYRGGENGGVIIKDKFKITNNKFILIDSIIGGSYSEGAGTWEWLISNRGNPEVVLFNGGDQWSLNRDKLLVTEEESLKTYLIDLGKKDTILTMPRPEGSISSQFVFNSRLLFLTYGKHHLPYLTLYDLHGNLLWTIETDNIEKILLDSDSDLVLASGYYFPGIDNTQRYFTIAYDLKTKSVKWSFPTNKIYEPKLNEIKNLSTSNLFKIGTNLYGLILGKVDEYFSQDINNTNKLIIFDNNGYVYNVIDLSRIKQKYAVIPIHENEFEIISNYESRRFKILRRL